LKVLLDSCVWGGVRKGLSDAGHDVVWAGDWSTDPGDEEILDRAHQEVRVLVTLDKDFGELAIVRGLPHSGLSRLVDLST
jgi:predicted nuclease of predicted toxin-antitoxin system